MTLIIAVALFISAIYFIPLVYGEAFSGSTNSLRILLGGAVLSSVAKVFSVFIVTRGKMVYNVISVTVGVAVTLILDLILIPRYGIEGASIATTVSYFAIFVVLLAFLKFKLGMKQWNYFVPDRGDIDRVIGKLKSW